MNSLKRTLIIKEEEEKDSGVTKTVYLGAGGYGF